MDRNECKQFAFDELEKWGLLEKGWTFEFNNAISYAGICYGKERQIRISGPICDVKDADFIKDTVRHEIAHALAGVGHAHDEVWQKWAREVGCSTDVTYKNCDAIEALKMSKVKYVMLFEDKIVKTYLRKPNIKTLRTLSNRYVPGMKAETLGKLKVFNYVPSIHKEFLKCT
jgi:predicted SprT family Zn-dependent metalloprotease